MTGKRKKSKRKVLAFFLAFCTAVSGAGAPAAMGLEEEVLVDSEALYSLEPDASADASEDLSEDAGGMNPEWESGFAGEALDAGGTEESVSAPEASASEAAVPEAAVSETAASEELFSDAPEDQLSDGEEDELSAGSSDGAEGIRYIKGRPLTEEEREEQLRPFENLSPVPDIGMDGTEEDLWPEEVQRVGAAPYYDARTLGLVSPVKNQGRYLDCWAFSLASQMETALLLEGSGLFDLSEEHLAYFWCHRENDPLLNTGNDFTNMPEEYHSGGNNMLGAFHLSTWSGMAQDALYPLGSGPFDGASAYDSIAFLKNAAFFSNNKTHSMSSRVTRIKNMIQTYKSASGLIAFSQTAYGSQGKYYNPDTAAFCNPVEGAVNHAITIVGWDDDYSKENFAEASNVQGNGAWIVKNSWGPSWGDNGYFYISYEDMSLKTIVCISGTANPEYRNNYFYDGTSGLHVYSLEAGESVACVYEAKAGNGRAETLGEIVTASGTDSASFAVQVYLGLRDPGDPTSGTAAYSGLNLSQPYIGMQTHKVPEVDIAPGTFYSVVLTNTTGKRISYYFEESLAYSWCSFSAGTDINQGFQGNSGSWTDLSGKNMSPRIKAHTRTESFTPSFSPGSTDITLGPGESYIVPVSTDPASYSSLGFGMQTTDRSVAYVNGDAIVAANPGRTTVEVWPLKAPNLSRAITVTVLPEAPAELTAARAAYNKVQLSWTGSAGCDGYYIFRQEQGGTPRYRRTITGAASTSAVDTESPSSGIYFRPGLTYRYYVKAYKEVDGEKIFSSPSPVREVKMQLDKESAVVRTFTGLYNTVTYNRIPGADGYRIFRRDDGGDWVLLHTRNSNVPAVLKDVWNLRNLGRYQYKAVPFRMINGIRYNGPYSCSGTLIAAPALTRVSALNVRSNGIQVVWNKQPGCTGYQVYRKEGSGPFKRIFTIKDPTRNSTTDTKAPKGVKIQYYVVSFVKEFYQTSVFGDYKVSSTVIR